MFESARRLKEEIEGLLGAIRGIAEGRYACIMEPPSALSQTTSGGKPAILFETPEPEGREIMTLRRLLEVGAADIFALPEQMAAEGEPGPAADPFEGWDHDEILLIFVNGRVAVVVACADAESSRDALMKPLQALVDRLLRYKEVYRFDAKGRGLFLGRPRLDFVTITKP